MARKQSIEPWKHDTSILVNPIQSRHLVEQPGVIVKLIPVANRVGAELLSCEQHELAA